MTKIGVEHEGRVYFGTVTKRTYGPKRYHVYVPELEATVKVEGILTYGAACFAIAGQQLDAAERQRGLRRNKGQTEATE